MPRTENRKVTYTIEYDIPALAAMGATTYFQTDRIKESLSNIGDKFVINFGSPPEFYYMNLVRARDAIKRAAEAMIVAKEPMTDGTVFSVSQNTVDFSSWDIVVKFRLIS